MKFSRLVVLACVSLLSSHCTQVETEVARNDTTPCIPQQHIVRVLIDESAHTDCHNQPITEWSFVSKAGFIVFDPAQPNKKRLYENYVLTITHRRQALYVNSNRYYHDQLRLIPNDGFAGVNDNQYHGSFSIVQKQDRVLLINHVNLEEYVCAVLQTESWPGWPIEVNKAFAVASRSYVMAMMRQAAASDLPYHVKKHKYTPNI